MARFALAPVEIQNLIIDHAADAADENIVEVIFTRQVTCRRERSKNGRFKPWKTVWSFRCYYRNPPALLHTSKQTRAQYILRHPQTIHLNRGPPVYFNASKDTIHFDSDSFFNLWYYVTVHTAPPSPRNLRALLTHLELPNLKGLEDIKTLGSYWRPKIRHRVHSQPLWALRFPYRRALNGLTSVRLLRPRGIHPCGGSAAYWIVHFGRRDLRQRIQASVSGSVAGVGRRRPELDRYQSRAVLRAGIESVRHVGKFC